MSADWKAGDKALCVDDSSQDLMHGETPVKHGTIYLVKDCFLEGIGGGMLLLTFQGLYTQMADCGLRGYRHTRFRKVVPACDRVAIEQEQEAST